MEDRVRELSRVQVVDPAKGNFYVKLKGTKQKYRGLRVYTDAFGRRIAINDAMGRSVTKRGKD